MSVKRIRCTDDVQKRGIAKLRDAMKEDMSAGLYLKLQKALGCFETGQVIIKQLLERAERYRDRDLAQKAKA